MLFVPPSKLSFHFHLKKRTKNITIPKENWFFCYSEKWWQKVWSCKMFSHPDLDIWSPLALCSSLEGTCSGHSFPHQMPQEATHSQFYSGLQKNTGQELDVKSFRRTMSTNSLPFFKKSQFLFIGQTAFPKIETARWQGYNTHSDDLWSYPSALLWFLVALKKLH